MIGRKYIGLIVILLVVVILLCMRKKENYYGETSNNIYPYSRRIGIWALIDKMKWDKKMKDIEGTVNIYA